MSFQWIWSVVVVLTWIGLIGAQSTGDCSASTIPTIKGISPSSGPAYTVVTISGSFPQAIPGATVKVFAWYGGAIASGYPSIVVSSFTQTSVTFQVPALPSSYPSTASIQYSVFVRPAGYSSDNGYPNYCVSTNGGYPTPTNTATFTYTTSDCSASTIPTITGISPSSGPAYTVVTITGSFPQAIPGATVKVFAWYGGAIASGYPAIVVSSFTQTSVTFQVPSLPSSYPSTASIQYSVFVRPAGYSSNNGYPNSCVSTNGGYPNSANTATFTYATSDCSASTIPTITGMTPSSGPAYTVVTITGSFPQAIPGATVKVFAWYGGAIASGYPAIVVSSFTPTSVTFQIPPLPSSIPPTASIQYSVFVRPAGYSSDNGYPNSCVSTNGGYPNSANTATFTYTTTDCTAKTIPTIKGISPSSGPAYTVVTITGSFPQALPGATVKVFAWYGGAVAPGYPSIVISSFTQTSITFKVPALPSSYPSTASIQYSVFVRPAGYPSDAGYPDSCVSTNGGYPTSTNTATFHYA